MKKSLWFAIPLLIILMVGWFTAHIMQLTLTDRIYVGEMAMDNPMVVGRDERFPKGNTAYLFAQLLQSVKHRMVNKADVTYRLVVTDSDGSVIRDDTITPDGYSTVVNLHPIQEKEGKYRLSWYIENNVIAVKDILIE